MRARWAPLGHFPYAICNVGRISGGGSGGQRCPTERPAGWLTAHTDDRSQHSAEDHCTRPRPSLVVLLAGSRRDRDAPDVLGGIVKPPGFRCVHWRCLWTQQGAPGGSAILGKSLPELIQGLHRPTRSLLGRLVPAGFPARTVSSRIPAQRRVAAWSDPAPTTAFAWALDMSTGSPSAASSTRAQQSRGHLDPLDYLREVTQHRGVLV